MIFHGKSGFAKAPHCTLLVLSTCVSGQGWYELCMSTVSAVNGSGRSMRCSPHFSHSCHRNISVYVTAPLIAEHNCSFA
jgi:hypothetical protein